MGVVVLLEMQVKPDAVDDVKTFMKDNLADTRNYAGYEGLDVYDNIDRTGDMPVYEGWDFPPQYETYLG